MAAKYTALADTMGAVTQTGDVYNAKRSAVESADAWSLSTRSKASAVAVVTCSSIFDWFDAYQRRETGIISVVSRIACELRIDSRL